MLNPGLAESHGSIVHPGKFLNHRTAELLTPTGCPVNWLLTGATGTKQFQADYLHEALLQSCPGKRFLTVDKKINSIKRQSGRIRMPAVLC